MKNTSIINFAKEIRTLPIFCSGFSQISEIVDSSTLSFNEDENPKKDSLFSVILELTHPPVDGSFITGVTFFKNDKAKFDSAETKGINSNVAEVVKKLVGFEGTWKQVMREINKLNRVVVSN